MEFHVIIFIYNACSEWCVLIQEGIVRLVEDTSDRVISNSDEFLDA
jgi:hypothetical protein